MTYNPQIDAIPTFNPSIEFVAIQMALQVIASHLENVGALKRAEFAEMLAGAKASQQHGVASVRGEAEAIRFGLAVNSSAKAIAPITS